MKKVKFLISIGNFCRTRYQIDRFMSAKICNYQPTSFFFDYLMMGNLSGVINIIQRDFILCPEDIYACELNGKFIARDRLSGMAFLHDFGASYFPTENECNTSIKKNMSESLRKFNYLGIKTANFLESEHLVGLVYHGNIIDAELKILRELIYKKYKKEFLIINVLENQNNNTTAYTIRDNALIEILVNDSQSPKIGSQREWEGFDESWNKAFSHVLLEW
jgi:hypothetical protein